MKKRIFILTTVFVAVLVANNHQASAQSKDNGLFEMISFSNDSVKFKTVTETKFYSIALVSGDQIFEGHNFSNSGGTVKWANGAQFRPGSSMPMPAAFNVGPMTLPKGIVMTISDFDVPKDFKATKIRFLTDVITEGTADMYYNIQTSSWEKKPLSDSPSRTKAFGSQ